MGCDANLVADPPGSHALSRPSPSSDIRPRVTSLLHRYPRSGSGSRTRTTLRSCLRLALSTVPRQDHFLTGLASSSTLPSFPLRRFKSFDQAALKAFHSIWLGQHGYILQGAGVG